VLAKGRVALSLANKQKRSLSLPISLSPRNEKKGTKYEGSGMPKYLLDCAGETLATLGCLVFAGFRFELLLIENFVLPLVAGSDKTNSSSGKAKGSNKAGGRVLVVTCNESLRSIVRKETYILHQCKANLEFSIQPES
jgi:hypothetical protein